MTKSHHLSNGLLCLIVASILVIAVGCGKDEGKAKNAQSLAVLDTAITVNSYGNGGEVKDSTVIERKNEGKYRSEEDILREIQEKVSKMGCGGFDNPYGFSSYKKVEESGALYGCAGGEGEDGIDFYLKPTDTDTLIKLIESLDKNSEHCCTEEYEDVYGDTAKFCIFKTDSIQFDYIEKDGKKFGPDYTIIRSQGLPISFGKVKVGMSWEKFLNVPKLNEQCPDIKYPESEYIGFELTGEQIFFYFEKGILREMISYGTL